MTQENVIPFLVRTNLKNIISRAIQNTENSVEVTIGATRFATVAALRSAGPDRNAGVLPGVEVLGEAIVAAAGSGGELGKVARGATVGILQGTAEVMPVTMSLLIETVRNTISEACYLHRDVGIVARAIAHGSVVATENTEISLEDAAFGPAFGLVVGANKIGADTGLVARSVMRGSIEGANEIGGDVVLAALNSAHGLVKGTYEIGDSIPRVAVIAVEGATEAAKSIGVNAGDPVFGAIAGVLEGAGEISDATVRTVTEALTARAPSFKVFDGALFKNRD